MEGDVLTLKDVLVYVGIIVTSLVGVVGVLWKMLMANLQLRLEKTEEKLDECETKHSEATHSLINLSARLGKLEGIVSSVSKESLNDVRSNDDSSVG